MDIKGNWQTYSGAAFTVVGLFLLAIGTGSANPANTAFSTVSNENIALESTYGSTFSGDSPRFAWVNPGETYNWKIKLTNTADGEWEGGAKLAFALADKNSRVVTATEEGLGDRELIGTTPGGYSIECFAGGMWGRFDQCRESLQEWDVQVSPQGTDNYRSLTGLEAQPPTKEERGVPVDQGETVTVDVRMTVPEEWDRRQRRFIVVARAVSVENGGSTSHVDVISPQPPEQVSGGEVNNRTASLGGGALSLLVGLGLIGTGVSSRRLELGE